MEAMGFEGLKAVKPWAAPFWVVISCNLVDGYRCFG